jgi:hypothetical protein
MAKRTAKTETARKGFLVRAVKDGIDGDQVRRRKGDQFFLRDGLAFKEFKTGKDAPEGMRETGWMEKVVE